MSAKTKALSEKLAHMAKAKPVTAPEDCPMKEALALMRKKQVPCLMIVKKGKLTGIFTERDYLMKAAGRAKPGDLIRDYMTPNPIIGRMDETVGEAIEIMNEKRLRQLPIVDQEGAPASIVTANTLISYLADHFPAVVVNRSPSPHLVSEESDGA